MRKVSLRRHITLMVIALAAVSTFCGCASLMFQTKSEQVNELAVSGAGYDVAYTKALKAVTDMGFSIFQTDKASGAFSADRGTGFSEISIFNFMIEKSGRKMIATIRIKSNQPERIREEFLRAYRRYVKVEPLS